MLFGAFPRVRSRCKVFLGESAAVLLRLVNVRTVCPKRGRMQRCGIPDEKFFGAERVVQCTYIDPERFRRSRTCGHQVDTRECEPSGPFYKNSEQLGPLGPSGYLECHQNRTLELILQEGYIFSRGSAVSRSSNPRSCRTF